MLARTAFCTAYVLIAGSWGKTACATGHGVYLELHGLSVSWDGKALGGYPSLQTKCKALHEQTSGAQFTVASGIDTSQSQVERIVKIIHNDCGGAHYIIYDILVRLSH